VEKDKLYSTQDIAEACGVVAGTIRNWIRKKKLAEVRKWRGKRYFTQADYDRFVNYANEHRTEIKEYQSRYKKFAEDE
jgi:DNA-binding transcriptional MerR regulator